MKHAFLALASLISTLVLGAAATAKAPDVSTLKAVKFEFVAWSTDSAYILLKVQDPNIPGYIFQVRDTKGETVKMGNKPAVFPSQFSPNTPEEQKFVKGIMNGKVKVGGEPIKFDQEGVFEATHPKRSTIMLMTGQKGDKLIIMGMRGERATTYESIDLIQDKNKVVAKASQKALVWDQEGKNFILIYNQKLDSKDTPFDGDFFEVHPFKSFKVKGASEETEE